MLVFYSVEMCFRATGFGAEHCYVSDALVSISERLRLKHLFTPIIKALYLPRSETRDRYTSMLPSLGAIFFSLFSVFSVVWAKSSTGNSVLVVLQPDLKRDNFSTFFNNLESKSKFRSSRGDYCTQSVLQNVAMS